MKRYLNMMIESLEKKLAVLEEIQEANVQQSALLKAEPFDQEAFDRTMDVKGEQIEKLDSLDVGFDNLYQQVRELLPAHKEEFHDEIAGMQDLIRKISEKSVSIQVGEQRNKAALESVIKRENGKLRAMQNKRRVMQSYASNMSQLNFVDPQFMDRKK